MVRNIVQKWVWHCSKTFLPNENPYGANLQVNGNVTESILEIKLHHEGTTACWDEVSNGILKSIIRYRYLHIGYPIINWWAWRPWKVINQARFRSQSFAKNYTQRWAAKLIKWGGEIEGAMSMVTSQEFVNWWLTKWWGLKGRFEIFWWMSCLNSLSEQSVRKWAHAS